MSAPAPVCTPAPVYYPSSDGKPMAENTVQFEWIVTLQGNIDRLFADRPDVFVAGDNFWYPVEGRPRVCQAPDVYVVFGRPKGHRPSYKQWEEGGIAPQVVIEVLSPGNRMDELLRKLRFYRRYGVQEYIVVDPDRWMLEAYERRETKLRPVPSVLDYTSPRLGVRFVTDPGVSVRVYDPAGRPFLTFAELAADRDRLAADRDRLVADRDRLAAKLRALGIDPDAV